MDPSFRNTMIGGVILYGAVGLASLVAVGLHVGEPQIALVAVASMGFAYAAQYAGAVGRVAANKWLTALSCATALVAFVALVVSPVHAAEQGQGCLSVGVDKGAVTLGQIPMPSPKPDTALLRVYMTYIKNFHQTTHTDGWNLDDMGVTGQDRDTLIGMGQSVEGYTPDDNGTTATP